jgi:hypothetical protein
MSPKTGFVEIIATNVFPLFLSSPSILKHIEWEGEFEIRTGYQDTPQIGLGGHFGKGYNRAPNVYCSHCKEYN